MKRAQLLICLWDRMVPGITTAQLALVEPDLNANVGSPARILQKQSFANRVQPESLRRIGGHGIADAASRRYLCGQLGIGKCSHDPSRDELAERSTELELE